MNKKKVAMVLNTSWNIYNFRMGLLKAIEEKGYEVVIIAPRDQYTEQLSKEFEYHNIRMNNKGTNPKEDVITIFNFYKLYKKIKPEIILHYTIKPNIYGTIAASLLNIKTINNIAGLGTLFVNQNLITKIAKWLYKYSQNKANKIFFQNKDDYKMFIEENLVQESKCDILPGSGVDTKKFIPRESKKKDDIFRFLLVSRMLWEKGINEYVEAAKIIKEKYKNVEFQLLGHIDMKSPTAISKKQIGIWIEEGYINYLGSSDDVRIQIAEVDCIVLPSFYREGTPRILLESASMQKPIITTYNVGCKDVIDDGFNGYLCKIKNVDDLVDKMDMMIKLTDEERKDMGIYSRKKMIKEYNESIIIEKYINVMKDL